jgi:hypothetical protein
MISTRPIALSKFYQWCLMNRAVHNLQVPALMMWLRGAGLHCPHRQTTRRARRASVRVLGFQTVNKVITRRYGQLPSLKESMKTNPRTRRITHSIAYSFVRLTSEKIFCLLYVSTLLPVISNRSGVAYTCCSYAESSVRRPASTGIPKLSIATRQNKCCLT